MRWKGIIFIVLFSAVLFALFYLISDNFLEKKIENTASGINGAKVELDNLDLSIFDLSISWEKLQVTNPKNFMKNSFETGKTELNLEFMPLIRGKVVIDTIEFMDVATNTDRKTSGELLEPQKQKKAKKTKSDNTEPGMMESAKLKMLSKGEDYKNVRLDDMKSNLNIDSIMLAVDLSSIEYIDSVKKDLDEKIKHWDGVIKSDEFQQDYAVMEQEFQELSKIDPKKIESISDLKKAVKKFNKAQKKFDKVNDKVKKYQKDFDEDFKNLKLAGNEIETKVKTDYKEIENVAQIPDIDTKNIASFVFGETVVQRVNRFFEITEQVAAYKKKLDKLKTDKEKPQRGKGQTIEFSGKYNYPDFWVKTLKFSGVLKSNSSIHGSIKDITSDQKLINKITLAEIKAMNPDKSNFDIAASIDTRTEKSMDSYKINYSDFALKNITVSQSSIFPYDVAKGMGNVESKIDINRGKYNGNLAFYGSNMEFRKNTKTSSKSEIQKFLDQSVSKLANLDVKCKFSNDNISINSNIDDIYNKEIKNYLDKTITDAQNKIRKEIDKEVNKAKADFEKKKKDAVAEIEKKLTVYRQEIENYLKEIDDKKSASEKEIKNKGEKALDNLFK